MIINLFIKGKAIWGNSSYLLILIAFNCLHIIVAMKMVCFSAKRLRVKYISECNLSKICQVCDLFVVCRMVAGVIKDKLGKKE